MGEKAKDLSEKAKDLSEWVIFKELLRFVRPYRKWVVISLICAAVISVCDIASVSFITKLINIINDSSREAITRIIMMLTGTLLLGVIASFLMPYSSGRAGIFAIRDIRNKVVMHYDTVEVAAKDEMHSGDITSRLSNDISKLEALFGNLSNYIYTPLIVIATTAYLLTIEWKLVILSFISIPIALILSNILSRPMDKYYEDYYGYLGETNSIIQDAITGISILKAYNLQEVFYKRCAEKIDKSLELYQRKINSRGCFMMPIMFMVYEFPYVVCATYGGYLAFSGEISAGSLIAFVLLQRFIVNPTSQLPNLIMNIRSSLGVGKRLLQLYTLQTERTSGEEEKQRVSDTVIDFHKVSFRYASGIDAIKDLSFKVNKGSNTAIVGASGCGKSTIINLICGFYKSRNGEIKVYGKNINHWKPSSLREEIALVAQDTYLYPDSIEENIRFGKPSSTREEVIRAAKAANAHNFIMELCNGYDTQVGERGVKLSGGQRQRLGIARAILKGAPILLLDEPTSALDYESELLIQQVLEEVSRDKTIITIAHRLSTIKRADRILVMDNGTMKEGGTHDELILKDGIYKKLYNQQNKQMVYPLRTGQVTMNES
ncbi:ABC transporter ATP-binding protein [Anaerocolumna sp. AGMB13020]|uniref:ABC transporter ATP-binding protein n=1 Tax=Anaerocolumna sp. AGMB13020 TaxID=3081750 RepID=UPI002955BA9B|nr:ABC transporter ATP-binding protein [Anaerocolumna sp. AGMB13020]WOO34793.1 ABC transporter ATP-binding protein [Anaerocolumna sp. AGMB13020]